MSQICVSGLTFYYDGSYDNIFEDVSFTIDTDWKLGFIGRNGRGKTTFLNLLMGKYEYRGSIASSVEFEYFPYPVSDKSKNGVELLEEIEPDYEFWRVCRELVLLDVEADVLYRPFGELSGGEQTKVLLALLFSKENRFLLIDEPTNHLDMEGRESVCRYLQKKKGFILVSHDREFLDRCIDHVLAINRADIQVSQGNFSDWWEQKQMQDAHEEQENERLKKDISRLKTAARRAGDWADRAESVKIGTGGYVDGRFIGSRAYLGEKSRKMQSQRKNMERRQERAIEEKSKLLKNVETAETLKILPLTHHKEVLISMEDVVLSYGGQKMEDAELSCGGKMVCGPLRLEVRAGDRIALLGKNGCGKSTVLQAVLKEAGIASGGADFAGGKAAPTETTGNREVLEIGGSLTLASGLKISFVPQDTSSLTGTLNGLADAWGIDGTLFRTLLRKLDFERSQFEKPVSDYSAGQKKKVLLAKSLCEQAHVYIWDEPLNYIDIFARMQLEELIKKHNLTMMFVEHDRRFVEDTATRQIWL